MSAKPFKLKMVEPKESIIQDAILRYLSVHPHVAFAARFNSGAMRIEGKGKRFIRFNTLPGCTDILGMLCDGRLLAIEVKRPSWKKPGDDRERAQESFIKLCRENGGVALFARRIDDVATAISEAISQLPSIK